MKRPKPQKLTCRRIAIERPGLPPVIRVEITRPDEASMTYGLDQEIKHLGRYQENPEDYRQEIWKGLERIIVLGFAARDNVKHLPRFRELYPITVTEELVTDHEPVAADE